MRVLVTGAARAIGRATVEVLAGRGHDVVATARDLALLDGLPAAQILPLDVSDAASVRAAVAAAGELDAIVNNAGRARSRAARVLPARLLQPGARREHPGPVPHGPGRGAPPGVSGQRRPGEHQLGAGQDRDAVRGPYAASKHALEALSESLYFELGHFGIRVVIIEPGYIAPGMKHDDDHSGPAVYADLHAQWSGTVDTLTGPGGRPGPELVGAAVADALEDPATPLRVEVGQDAAMVLRAAADAR